MNRTIGTSDDAAVLPMGTSSWSSDFTDSRGIKKHTGMRLAVGDSGVGRASSHLSRQRCLRSVLSEHCLFNNARPASFSSRRSPTWSSSWLRETRLWSPAPATW